MKESLDQAVLRLLETGPDYGGSLIARLRTENYDFGWVDRYLFDTSQRVYHVLRQLENEGHLRSWNEPDTTGARRGHPRRMYTRGPTPTAAR